MEPTSLQIVDQVIAGSPDWKRPVRALEQLPPDAASVRIVIDALERRVCESWLAACLLGAIGHPDGYATALALLRSRSDVNAKAYAGPALTRMRGDAALPDLAAVLEDASFDRKTHEGAAYGLGAISDPHALDVLVAALDAEHIRMGTAGFVLNERPFAPALLLEWLRGDQPRRRTTAAWALFYRTANAVDSAIPRELSDALFAEINRGGLPFTTAQEQILRERLA